MPTDDDTKPPANALSNGGVWTSGEPTGGETSVSDAMLASSAGGSVTRESSLLDEPARRRASSRRRRRRRRWVVGGVLAALVTAIGVSIVVYFVGQQSQFFASHTEVAVSKHEDATSPTTSTDSSLSDRVSGMVRVIGGPFARYDPSLDDPTSVLYTITAESFQFQVDALFKVNRLSSIYNSTKVHSFQEGSLLIFFSIFFTKDLSTTILDDVRSLIADASQPSGSFGVFVLDDEATSLVFPIAEELNELYLGEVEGEPLAGCQPLMPSPCQEMRYNATAYPNVLGHRSQVEAFTAGMETALVLRSKCYVFIDVYWCALFMPPCAAGVAVPPCRSFCQKAKEKCGHVRNSDVFWPNDCRDLPESDDPNVCVADPIQRMSSLPTEPPRCRPVRDDRCAALGFQLTDSPHMHGYGERWVDKGMGDVADLVGLFHCYELIELFGCSVLGPRCVTGADGRARAVPPCRGLCEDAKHQCGFFFALLGADWARDVDCDALPDSDNEDVCTGGWQRDRLAERRLHCPDDELRCDTDRCIPRKWMCDGVTDCKDGRDEARCAVCGLDFKCDNSECIRRSKICDGTIDCLGGEDEEHCVRLVGGSESAGRLEVYDRPVCADKWTDALSDLACIETVQRRANTTGHRRLRRGAGSSAVMILDHSTGPKLGTHRHRSIVDLLSKVDSCPSSRSIYLSCNVVTQGCSPILPWPFDDRQLNSGVDLPDTAWPWLVSIHGGPDRNFFCGATLLNSEWVMTAAHCIGVHTSPEGWSVSVGHTRLAAFNEFGQDRGLREIRLHPQHEIVELEFDIALMRLDKPVQFTRYVAPVCLPPAGLSLSDNNTCYVAGWGKPHSGALHYRSVAQARRVHLVGAKECWRAIEKAEPYLGLTMTKSSLCAKGFCGMDARRGDSGSPMVCRVPTAGGGSDLMVIGVVSWGVDGPLIDNVPGVYADVRAAAAWIADVIRQ